MISNVQLKIKDFIYKTLSFYSLLDFRAALTYLHLQLAPILDISALIPPLSYLRCLKSQDGFASWMAGNKTTVSGPPPARQADDASQTAERGCLRSFFTSESYRTANRPQDPETGQPIPPAPRQSTPQSPLLTGVPRVKQIFDPEGYDKTYFDHFRSNPSELRFLVVHDFRYLQMKNIYYYQMELLQKYPPRTSLNQDNIADLRKLLADYCIDVPSLTRAITHLYLGQALQDYEYVLRLPKPSSGKARIQRECLEHALKGTNLDRSDHRLIPGSTVDFLERILSQDLSDVASNSTGLTWTGKFQTLRRDLSGKDIMRRIFVGTFVGAPFLLVPMIILQFRTTTAWKLSTVSIAVVLFSVFLGVCSEQNNGDHLVAVAAYAAVMVVFVGTSTTG
ncbi:hypothetical protein B0O99DRAFT_333361 [Bisporella sp. PMI_857]|nr:hypothetical protein B0O99DRAFT_333361 [Bisporella sp. PMI_857]